MGPFVGESVSLTRATCASDPPFQGLRWLRFGSADSIGAIVAFSSQHLSKEGRDRKDCCPEAKTNRTADKNGK